VNDMFSIHHDKLLGSIGISLLSTGIFILNESYLRKIDFTWSNQK